MLDTTQIPDIYADDMEVQDLGPCFRGVYFVYSRMGDSVEKQVVAKIVRPITSTRPDLFRKLKSGLLVPVQSTFVRH